MEYLTHIYCGEGKGKTTTAIGLTIRSLSAGYSVIFVQFLKSNNSSEIKLLQSLDNIELLHLDGEIKFSFLMNEQEKVQAKIDNNNLFKNAISKIKNEKTLIVFDEILGAIECNLIDQQIILDFLNSKPKAEIVLTGRNSTQELDNFADYISIIQNKKHPFEQGVNARIGIEY